MATTAARVVARLGAVSDIAVVGGGARAGLLLDRLRAATGLPVVAGPVEAAAMGNALVQGIALGQFADLAEARRALADAG